MKKMRRNIGGSKQNYYDDGHIGPPRISKKQRPFSAPRH